MAVAGTGGCLREAPYKAALDGAAAVPCTCNPLQQGGIPGTRDTVPHVCDGICGNDRLVLRNGGL